MKANIKRWIIPALFTFGGALLVLIGILMATGTLGQLLSMLS